MKLKGRIISFVLVIIILVGHSVTVFANSNKIKWEVVNWEKPVDIYSGEIDLAEVSIKEDDIIGFDILRGDKRANLLYRVEGTKVKFISEMQLNTNYSLRVITYTKHYDIKFKSNDLPNITETGREIIIKVPAIPEKGFNWPYYLRIPSTRFKNELENETSKRYLLVDTTNGGPQNLEGTEAWVKDMIKEDSMNGNLSELLYTPYLMPVIPRTNIRYKSDEGANQIYEHALDRDTIFLKQIAAKNPDLVNQYKEKGFNIEDFYDLDKQVIAMIDHAIEYLNKYKHNVDKEKVVLNGFSASGEFANRLAFYILIGLR